MLRVRTWLPHQKAARPTARPAAGPDVQGAAGHGLQGLLRALAYPLERVPEEVPLPALEVCGTWQLGCGGV